MCKSFDRKKNKKRIIVDNQSLKTSADYKSNLKDQRIEKTVGERL